MAFFLCASLEEKKSASDMKNEFNFALRWLSLDDS